MNTRNMTILLIVLLVIVALIYALSGCQDTSPVRDGQQCVPKTCPSGGCPGEDKQIEIGKKKEPLWKV